MKEKDLYEEINKADRIIIAISLISSVIILCLIGTICITGIQSQEKIDKLQQENQLYKDWITETEGLNWIFLTWYEQRVQNETKQ